MERASRKRRVVSFARNKRDLASKTTRATKERTAAQIPRAYGALAEVQAGQSPMWPIPMGRASRSRSSISNSVRTTLIASRIPPHRSG